MRIVTLSDHTTDKASALASARRAKYDAKCAAFALILARQAQVVEACRKKVHDARARRAWWAWIKAWFKLWEEKGRFIGRQPQLEAAGRDEAVWNAGKEGEDRVAARLGSQLSDEWTLIQGYENPKGEIDQVLVGPQAVVAIEIKFTSGVVHISGDRWSRDKYDNYGNLVETGVAITDRGGRSPSRQLNEAADELREFLKSRFGVKVVHRMVVLSHDKAQLGRVDEPTVRCIVTLVQLDGGILVSRMPFIYDEAMRAKVVTGIADAHARLRSRRSSARAGRGGKQRTTAAAT
jgi:hypothetical protein